MKIIYGTHAPHFSMKLGSTSLPDCEKLKPFGMMGDLLKAPLKNIVSVMMFDGFRFQFSNNVSFYALKNIRFFALNKRKFLYIKNVSF